MLRRIPVIAALLALLSLLMLVPAVHAVTGSDWRSARGFFYPAMFGLLLAAGVSSLLRPMSSPGVPSAAGCGTGPDGTIPPTSPPWTGC